MAPAPESHGDGLKQAVVALVIIALLLVLGFWLYGTVNQVTVEDLGDGRQKLSVSEGRVISNFPEELIQEDDPEYLESYSINEADAEQPVVRYRSALSFSENVNLFNAYFEGTGWLKTAEPENSNGPVASFYAYRDKDQANVTLSRDGDGRVIVEVAFLGGQL